jgi:hypothetical protein
MKRLSTPLQFTFALLVIALLVACAPGAPAPSSEEIAALIDTAVAMTVEAQGQIAESVALTVAAQQTEQAALMATPTLTPTALPTLTPILPTATPFVIKPSGGGGGGGGGGGTSPKADYACDVITKPFPDYVEFNKNAEFDIKWTIVNTGRLAIPAGNDVMYVDGPNMTKNGATFVEIPVELKPGDTYTIIFDAVAPSGKGKHLMRWKLEGGICWPYVAITVK